MSLITFYEITHKYNVFIPKGRTALFVGTGKNEDNYLSDDTGENISQKNKNYCELTALYWIWKNDKTSEYISIEHYRRFFMNPYFTSVLREKAVQNYLKKYDAISTRCYKFPETVKTYYEKNHVGEDLVLLKEVISLRCPEYLDEYEKVLNGTQSCMCNMLVISKKNFDDYCGWLFDILFDLEKRIDVSARDSYQQRVFGFLSERLMNVWMLKNKLTVKHVPIYYLENSTLRSILKSLKHRFSIKCIM